MADAHPTSKNQVARTFVFNFQRQFAPKVESGEKRQTIRAWRKDGKIPRQGDRARLYTGLRMPGARLLRSGTVTACFPVSICDGEIVADGVKLGRPAAQDFAQLDGFPHLTAMLEWFGAIHGRDFDGFCVRWRDEE